MSTSRCSRSARKWALALRIAALTTVLSPCAFGEPAASPASPAAGTSSPPPASHPPTPPAVAPVAVAPPAPPPSGLAVVALPGAAAAAWPLAQGVYAVGSLRPAALDEPHARILCGEHPAGDAPPEQRELADVVSALHGDDAPTRALLAEVSRRLAVRALVVVGVDGGHAEARVYLPDSAAFDAARYEPDGPSGSASWSAAVQSIERAYGVETLAKPAASPPPARATQPAPANLLSPQPSPKKDNPPGRTVFYQSGWFWAALGAAAFGAGAVFLATRDSGAQTIHLELKVPH